MKRIIVLLTAWMLFIGQAQAQEFSARGGIQLLLLPGINFALEYNEDSWGIGARGSGSYLLLFLNVQVDAYAIVPLSTEWQLYIGGGWGRYYSVLSKPLEEFHALLGVRLKQGFFIEIISGVGFGEACVPLVTPVAAARPQTPACGAYVPTTSFIISLNLGFSWSF